MKNPKFPVYVPTKGRWGSSYTAKMFDRLQVPYNLVVQPKEADLYSSIGLKKSSLLLLPEGLDGLVPTRNWIWEHPTTLGTERFWTFDDNIRNIYRLNRNMKIPVGDGSVLRVIEDFIDRFENAVLAGMHYEMFCHRRNKYPPFYLNHRVYSNMLILTDARDHHKQPYRNVGVYNDDTDLCLRVLKDGWCTVLFNAFLVDKVGTMRVPGGNTPIYEGDGRLKMAQELQMRHPDVVRITRKWGRWQHHVDYSRFAANRLRVKPGVIVKRGVDDRGMTLQQLAEDGSWKEKDPDELSAGSAKNVHRLRR